jgi:hypothetical protein
MSHLDMWTTLLRADELANALPWPSEEAIDLSEKDFTIFAPVIRINSKHPFLQSNRDKDNIV